MNSRVILIAIFLILSLVLGALFSFPKYQDFKVKQVEIKEKEIDLQQLEEYYSNLEKTSKELEIYKEVLSKLDPAMPRELSLPSVYNFFQKTSSQSGLVLKDISPVFSSPIKEGSDIKKHSLSISLSGSYSSLKNFLAVLENSARFFETESISFSSPSGKSTLPTKEETFTFNLKIKVYSY